MQHGQRHPEIVTFPLLVRPLTVVARQVTHDRITGTLSPQLLSFSEGKTLLIERQKCSLLALHEEVGGGEFILAFYRLESVPMMKWVF